MPLPYVGRKVPAFFIPDGGEITRVTNISVSQRKAVLMWALSLTSHALDSDVARGFFERSDPIC